MHFEIENPNQSRDQTSCQITKNNQHEIPPTPSLEPVFFDNRRYICRMYKRHKAKVERLGLGVPGEATCLYFAMGER